MNICDCEGGYAPIAPGPLSITKKTVRYVVVPNFPKKNVQPPRTLILIMSETAKPQSAPTYLYSLTVDANRQTIVHTS
jgi:hypothetical protein